MGKLYSGVLAATFVLGTAGQALAQVEGFSATASLGQGVLLDPKPVGSADASTLLLGAGYDIGAHLRAELGLVIAMQNRRSGIVDLQLRPMFVIAPEGWPVYARATWGLVQIIHGPISMLLGGAFGGTWDLRRSNPSADPLVLFAEVGALAHTDRNRNDQLKQHWILEARAGGRWHF